MKSIITIILIFTVCCFSACSKTGALQTVSGTIDGVPALTLYGNSGRPADYVFLSKDASVKKMAYNGSTYAYYNTAQGIYITLAPYKVVSGSLAVNGSVTVLYVDTATVHLFGSTQYTSK